MPQITIEGVNYHYAAGLPAAGEPQQAVLFVHGAGGSHRHWAFQITDLKQDYLALAVDLPGHAQSAGQAADNIPAYREFVRSFTDRLLGAPFFLAGHSMGGAIALDFARCYPHRLAGIILVGTGCRLRVLPAMLEAFRQGGHYPALLDLAYGPWATASLKDAAAQEMAAVAPEVYLADFTACDRFDLTADLAAINVPALVVTADQDRLTPVKYGQYLKERLPRATLEIIPGAGHMMMLEQPAPVNRAIRNFLSGRNKKVKSPAFSGNMDKL